MSVVRGYDDILGKATVTLAADNVGVNEPFLPFTGIEHEVHHHPLSGARLRYARAHTLDPPYDIQPLYARKLHRLPSPSP